MIAMSDIADTLSFGLVRRIRKRTHLINDHVPTIANNYSLSANHPAGSTHSASFPSLSSNLHSLSSGSLPPMATNSFTTSNICSSLSTDNINGELTHTSNCPNTTITAAYSFDSSVLSVEGKKHMLQRSKSYPGKRMDVKLHRTSSLSKTAFSRPNCPVPIICKTISKASLKKNGNTPLSKIPSVSSSESSLPDSYKTIPLYHVYDSSTIGKTPRKVTIADHPTDLESGETLLIRKVPTENVQSTLLEDDSVSLYSTNPEVQLQLVLDDKTFPGFP